MKKIPIGLILNDSKISKWQRECLNYISDLVEIKIILNCKKKTKVNYKKFLYYLLNLITLKNSETKKKIYINAKPRWANFNTEISKKPGWEKIPKKIYGLAEKEKVKFILKFGIGLLEVTNKNIPILSFHHGDPRKYLGRPAGFYEIYNKEKYVGISVQKLSNKLDRGIFLYTGYSKIFPYSYKKTSKNFYKISKFVLRKSIDKINKKKNSFFFGKKYFLPSNSLVIKFTFIVFINKIKYFFKTILFEKKWNLGKIKCKNIKSFLKIKKIDLQECLVSNKIKKYSFLADPMLTSDKKSLRVEAMNPLSGKGEIIIVDKRFNFIKKEFSGNHYSYPQSFFYKNKEIIFPEISSHNNPKFYFYNKRKINSINLRGLENIRIVDGTIFIKNKIIYLFFCEKGSDVLQLFFSNGINSKFVQHKKSPIKINPDGSRMAGDIIRYKNKIYRLGQNNSDQYGKCLSIYLVNKITKSDYNEQLIGKKSIKNFNGPHTLSIANNEVFFDYYKNAFNLLAIYKKILARI